MPTNSNPAIVWRRIQVDIWRLSDFFKRNGTEEQKDAVRQTIDTLNTLAHHFEFTPIPPNLAASLGVTSKRALVTKPMPKPQPIPEQSLAYTQGSYGPINERMGMPVSNPYDPDEQMTEHADWQRGYEDESNA